MASVTVIGEDVRRTASDLRRESAMLRMANRRALREARRRRHECLLSYARARRIRAQPVLSPWSDLLWRRADPTELRRVLVPVNGGR